MAKISPKSNAPLGFFKTIGASLYSPAFYAIVGKRTFGNAAWYVARLAVLYALILSVAIVGPIVAKVGQDFFAVFQSEVVELYPNDLIITIEEGKATTNQPEPIIISLPTSSEFKKGFKEGLGRENVLVIDTQTPFSSEEFESYNTFAWLTGDSLFFYNASKKGMEGYPLKTTKSVEITKEKVQKLGEKVTSILKWALPMIWVLTIVFIAVGLWIIALLYGLVLGVLISILKSIFHQNASYAESYITALYATTWVYVSQITLQGIHRATGFEPFTLMVTLLTLIAVGWNLKKVVDRG